MATYGATDILLMERTEAFTVPANGAATEVTIPTISTQYGDIRPIAFALASMDAAITNGIEVQIGNDGDLGDAITFAQADLAPTSQYVGTLGPETVLSIESVDANVGDLQIRWFWPNGVADDRLTGVPRDSVMPLKSETVTAVAAEAQLSIPEGAVELVITSVTNDMYYRLDDGTATGEQIEIAAADVTFRNPYVVPVNDGDRLRLQRGSGGVDSVIQGYWVLVE